MLGVPQGKTKKSSSDAEGSMSRCDILTKVTVLANHAQYRIADNLPETLPHHSVEDHVNSGCVKSS
jgi:hypothetical protein